MSGKGIAIVGYAGRFPGAPSARALWELVVARRSASIEVPNGRWPISTEAAYTLGGAIDHARSRRACFLDPFELDRAETGLPPELFAQLGEVARLTLRVGIDAWASFSSTKLDRDRIGVVLANIALPTDGSSALAEEVLLAPLESELRSSSKTRLSHTLEGRAMALPAGLLARTLGLGGGSFTLDAACASSLYALHLACADLESGRRDAMLAGGVARPHALYTQIGFSQLQALSPSGVCAPFDRRADGLVVGEGAGIFVLKRLEDAQQAGDHIHGIIRGIGLSNDLDGSLLSPASEGQLRAMRAAYEDSGWSPSDVDLVECHGTGTPVGDGIELASLHELRRGSDQRCVVGSVKSNVGHLLTAAGAAGLCKVLMALQERQLPPSANFALQSAATGLTAPLTALEAAESWSAPASRPRRAAVSGFGFGGINAHLLIEEPTARATAPVRRRAPSEPLAIVGMSAQFGSLDSLDAFREAVFHGDSALKPLPRTRWRGAQASPLIEALGLGSKLAGNWLESLDLPQRRFKIPPREFDSMLPQQALLLRVAAEAFDDLRSTRASGPNPRSGAIVGLGLDLETTSFHLRWLLQNRAASYASELGLDLSAEELSTWAKQLADALCPPLDASRTTGALGGLVASRVAREFQLGGPCFAVSADESSGLKALEVAAGMLQRRELDLAFVGAVDIAGDARQVIATHTLRPFSSTGSCRPFDREANGTAVGEGAAALVLKRLTDAERDGDRIYATLRGITSSSAGALTDHESISRAYTRAAAESHAEAGIDPVSIGYVEAHGSGSPSEDAAEALGLCGAFPKSAVPRTAVSSLTPITGQAGAAGSLGSVVKASLALFHRVLPPLPGLHTPASADWEQHGFHFASDLLPWHRNRVEGPRRAGVSSIGLDGSCAHAVLESHSSAAPHPSTARSAAIFLLRATSDTAQLKQMAESHSGSLQSLARTWFKQGSTSPVSRAIVARDVSELRSLLSASAPSPVKLTGDVAITFPGAGNHYLGMGRGLALGLPQVYEALDARSEWLSEQLQSSFLSPWRSSWEENWESSAIARLNAEPERALLAQVAHGIAVHDALRLLGLKPNAYLGYSLGESAAFLASGTWADRDLLFRRTRESPLFRTALAGERSVLREAWGGTPDWSVAVLARGPEQVKSALTGRAALLAINSPSECVVGGPIEDVKRVAQTLGCEAFSSDGVPTVHIAAVERVRAEYRALHELPTTTKSGARFYSAGAGGRFEPTPSSAAESILTSAIQGFDFASVVRQAYADGVRIFVEAGPQGSCTRMIGQVLAGQPHLAISADTRGKDGYRALLDAVARLAEVGVPVDLAPLYGADSESSAPSIKRGEMIRLRIGGPPRHLPRPPVRTQPQPPPPPVMNIEPPRPISPSPAGSAHGAAHETFLLWANRSIELQAKLIAQQQGLLAQLSEHPLPLPLAGEGWGEGGGSLGPPSPWPSPASGRGNSPLNGVHESPTPIQPLFDRRACELLATGKLSEVLGPQFAAVDSFPTRVRLPDGPLNLVDRIMSVEGTKGVLGPGRVITEHDVKPGAWYLDSGRAPVCISVEAGQADLFLSGYLGIDLETKGERVYRLLDAKITFHRELPKVGETLRYDIQIDRFIRQGDTWLFFFRFEGFANGQPLLTMTEGCAGFFSAEQLATGRGIVMDPPKLRAPREGSIRFTSLVNEGPKTLSETQLAALKQGDLESAFGRAFQGHHLAEELRIPDAKLHLIDRVLDLDPSGGRYGLGTVHAEADITPDAWFLTCHFTDDPVMPGTLMYECCLHTLRTLLLRLGWTCEPGQAPAGFHYAPVIGTTSRLRCRGQVIPSTKKVSYRVDIKEIGYGPEPYVIADASMFADGRHVVEMEDMSVRLVGMSQAQIESTWLKNTPKSPSSGPLYPRERIVHFAEGQPSIAFGDKYLHFDSKRRLARLPRDPFLFLDRVISADAPAWEMKPGGWIEGEFDVQPQAWFFAANRQRTMPFAVLLEAALQPCGWLAAYAGSALHSEEDLHFRNLDGNATQLREIPADVGTLRCRARMTKATAAGGMILQDYEMEVLAGSELVYRGTTGFGFFPAAALANQVGLRNETMSPLDSRASAAVLPIETPLDPSSCDPREAHFERSLALPARAFSMLDRLDVLSLEGGAKKLGFIAGSKKVDPAEWFFRAHFFQDPVMPGSLGLEALIQLMKLYSRERFGRVTESHRFESMALNRPHKWQYRGQIIPTNGVMTVQATITHVEDGPTPLVVADGVLAVDGKPIYAMKDFSLRLVPGEPQVEVTSETESPLPLAGEGQGEGGLAQPHLHPNPLPPTGERAHSPTTEGRRR